jgi:hypothetical protein
MATSGSPRRRPSVHVTLPRAARLHRLVTLLAQSPRGRNEILATMRVGLRTFYRELVLLKRCGVKVRHKAKLYHLMHTAAEAEGRLPFPDPQLSFAEMAELAQCECPAGKRLGDLLAWVINQPEPSPRKASRGKKATKAKPKTKGSTAKSQ